MGKKVDSRLMSLLRKDNLQMTDEGFYLTEHIEGNSLTHKPHTFTNNRKKISNFSITHTKREVGKLDCERN